MLPLKKFLKYEGCGDDTVAVFETGFVEFIEFIDEGGIVPYGIDVNQVVSRRDLEKWVSDAEQMGTDTSAHQRVLAEWPVSP